MATSVGPSGSGESHWHGAASARAFHRLRSRLSGSIRPRPWVPQPLLGLGLALFALVGLALSWRAWLVGAPPGLAGGLAPLSGWDRALPLTCLLAAGVALALLVPVHLARGAKVYLTTVPLFVLAALVPAPLAATAAGLAVLGGELAQRRAKGSWPSDIACTVGRHILVLLAASAAAHAGASPSQADLLLAAGVLYGGQTLTAALEIGAITGEALPRVLGGLVRADGAAEGAQLLLGVLGALAARQAAWALLLLPPPLVLLRQLLKHRLELHEQTRTLLESLADTVDLRDPSTGGHSRRVAAYTAALLAALGLRGPEVDLIVTAARVHDIGKIAVPDRLLGKPGGLSAAERAVMEGHAARGADFLARYADFRRGVGIVRHHHERVDGAGYPSGLRGDAIPFGARVIAVADSYDAMTSERPYRPALPPARAAALLAEGRGTQWDGALVDVFLARVAPTLPAPASPSMAGETSTLAPPADGRTDDRPDDRAAGPAVA